MNYLNNLIMWMNELNHHEEELELKKQLPEQNEEVFETLSSESIQDGDNVNLESFKEEIQKIKDFMQLREYRISTLNRDKKEMVQARMREVLRRTIDYTKLKSLRDKIPGGFIPENIIDTQIEILLFYEKNLDKLKDYIDEAKDVVLEKIIIVPLFKALKFDPITSKDLEHISTHAELVQFFEDKTQEKRKQNNEKNPPIKITANKPLPPLKISHEPRAQTPEEIKRMKLHASPRSSQNIKKSTPKSFNKNGKRYSK